MKYHGREINTITEFNTDEQSLIFNNAINGKRDYKFTIKNPIQKVSFDKAISLSTGYIDNDDNTNYFILNAEDAIELGQRLIKSATIALMQQSSDNNVYRMFNMIRNIADKGYLAKIVYKFKRMHEYIKNYAIFEVKCVPYSTIQDEHLKEKIKSYNFEFIIDLYDICSYKELEKIAVSITNIANDKTKITVSSNEELYRQFELQQEEKEKRLNDMMDINNSDTVAIPISHNKDKIENALKDIVNKNK